MPSATVWRGEVSISSSWTLEDPPEYKRRASIGSERLRQRCPERPLSFVTG